MNSHEEYELFEEIGRGQDTIVYHGFDLRLQRDVAIKILTDATNAERRKRLLAEAQFLAQHEHESIVRVYDVDMRLGWVVMELAPATLADIVAVGPSSAELVRSMLRQSLSALQFLHARDKIHGGVRPSNLLVNANRRIKLSDLAQSDPRLEVRVPSGDRMYLAPELLQPSFGPVAATTDLYALGLSALEMLIGPTLADRIPGIASGSGDLTLAWMRWHIDPQPYPEVRTLASGVADDLCQVLDSMLVKPVAQRVASAEEAIAGLNDSAVVLMPADIATSPAGIVSDPTRVRELAPMPKVEFVPGEAASAFERQQPKKREVEKRKKQGKPSLMTMPRSRNALLAGCAVVLLIAVAGAASIGKANKTVNNSDLPLPEEPTLVSTEVLQPEPVTPEPEIPEPEIPEPEIPEPEIPEPEIPEPEVPEPEQPALPRFQLPPEFAPLVDYGFDSETQLPLRIRSTKVVGELKADFLFVPAGTYRLGTDEPERMSWERSAADFVNPQPFYIAMTETPVAHYRQFAEREGDSLAGTSWRKAAAFWQASLGDEVDSERLPVSLISRESASRYAQWMGASLPSEDQWEAGATVAGADDAEQVRTFRGGDLSPRQVAGAGYLGEFERATHVLGNLAEWTAGDEPIARGAGYATAHGEHVRLAWRSTADPEGQWDVGIRLIVVVQGNDPRLDIVSVFDPE